jgi:hypothetical protein
LQGRKERKVFMRKALLIVAMLLLVTPVMATTTITAVKESQTRTPDGNEFATVRISYSGTAGVDANVRAFALDINIDSDGNNRPNFQRIADFNKGEANGTSGHSGYGIFPSRFRDFVNPTTPDACYADPNYNPTTAYNEPETTDHNSGMGFPKMIVEMGTLYAGDANRPAMSGTLFRFDVNSWGATGTFTLHIAANALRGGVVGNDGNAITPTLTGTSITFTLPAPAAPASITYPATSDTGRYTVSWPASAGATSYVVERSRDGGTNWAVDANYVSGISYLSDEPNTTTNKYRVRACSGSCSDNTTGAGSTVVTYCFGDSLAGVAQWKLVGRPRCWCYPRQCHGDADGLQQGKAPNQVWVGGNDLTILTKAWNKTAAQLKVAPEPNACADFDRAPQGKAPNVVQVAGNDLTVLTNNWTGHPPSNGNPPADCVPGNKVP